MRWLVRLVTPPGATILDPFAGSGTTGEAVILEGGDRKAILIERDATYIPLIEQRLSKYDDPVAWARAQRGEKVATTGKPKVKPAGDGDLFAAFGEPA